MGMIGPVDNIIVCVDKTLAARGPAGWGTCANYLDFFENYQFHVIYCVTLALCTFF